MKNFNSIIRGHGLFDRKRYSDDSLPKKTERIFPPPSFIFPTKPDSGELKAREEYRTTTYRRCFQQDGNCGVARVRSPNFAKPRHPPIPKRDSVVCDKPESSTTENVSRMETPGPRDIEYNLPRPATRRPATPRPATPRAAALPPLSPPGHLCSHLAALQAWKFAQQHRFDLVYVIHMSRSNDTSLPQPTPQTYHGANLMNTHFAGQIVAAYGLWEEALPLKMPLNESLLVRSYSELHDRNASPFAYGQTFAFHRSLSGYINRGILLGAYRKAKGGIKLLQHDAEELINCLQNIYLENGLGSLRFDSRSPGAESLAVTMNQKERYDQAATANGGLGSNRALPASLTMLI